jgi:PKD repeat protein
VNTYSVTLTVSNASGTNSQTKTDYISVGVAQCVVPNVSDGSTRKNAATTTLQDRGFVVDAVGGPGNWRVRVQSPAGGLSVACGSTVQIFE